MQILKSVQIGFASMGMTAATQKHLLNSKNLLILFILCLALGFSCIHIFIEANTFQEYTVSAYTFASLLLATVICSICMCKMRMIFGFIHQVENTINESELVVLNSTHV